MNAHPSCIAALLAAAAGILCSTAPLAAQRISGTLMAENSDRPIQGATVVS